MHRFELGVLSLCLSWPTSVASSSPLTIVPKLSPFGEDNSLPATLVPPSTFVRSSVSIAAARRTLPWSVRRFSLGPAAVSFVPSLGLFQTVRGEGNVRSNRSTSLARHPIGARVAFRTSAATAMPSAAIDDAATPERQSAASGRRRGVLVVGSANQDLTSYTAHVPTMGQTVLGQRFETTFGGKGANQAVAAAGLRCADVTMVCKVGQDSFGSALLANFRQAGVQYDESKTVVPATDDSAPTKATTTEVNTLRTGVAPIVVDVGTGDNMIIVIPGANHALSPDDVRSSILSLPEPPAVVVSQLEILPEAALEAMRVGKEVGATTILNPAPAPEDWELGEEHLRDVDIVIPNESELQSLCRSLNVEEAKDGSVIDREEMMARTLLDKGVGRAVIVTLGARGAMVVSKTGDANVIDVAMVSAPADLPCNADPVRDTVGAGDAFCGSLSAYLSAGLTLSDAATRACGVASMSVRKLGAQSSYPNADELPDVLRVDVTNNAPKMSLQIANKPTITFVTGNKKKLEEVQLILGAGGEFPFSLANHKVDLPELQGDPFDIATEKCNLAATAVGGPVLTEDTSLCFNALNGMPGPYIKWFLDKCGHDGLNDMLIGFDDKTAYAQTVVAFSAGPGQKVKVFDGRTDGSIVRPRGPLDFGWDPIFEPNEGGGKTYAEMSKDEKNAISHRGRSFAKLRAYLRTEADAIKLLMMDK